MKPILDLHMHSNNSLDGDYDIETLVDLCDKAGLKYVSLADHNSVAGVQEMMRVGKSKGITVIPAIEIDCAYNDTNLHILGYNIDIEDPRFNQLGVDLLNQERDGSKERIRLVEALGIYVNHDKIEELQIDGIVTGEMIAEAAFDEPENEGLEILKPFMPGGALADNPYVNFYWEYCAQGKPAYIPIEMPTLDSIISLIHETGGTAVFAHPGHNIKDDPQLLNEIMTSGLDGIEAYSSYHSNEQIKFYEDYALEHNKLITCGSDFHGKIKPAIELGKIIFPEDYFNKVVDRLVK